MFRCCQQELLNLPFVKQKNFYLFIHFFRPREQIDFSCPLLLLKKLAAPGEGANNILEVRKSFS